MRLSQFEVIMEMKVRFVNPQRVYSNLKTELDNAYFQIMESGEFVARRALHEFEANLAEYVGTKYAVGLNSGYDALHLSLRAAGIGAGDEVIVPAHTFVATCSAIVNVNAVPVLVDVGKDFNIDVAEIEKAITRKTKAILPVHLSGIMANMPKILELASKHNLIIVEDACQALGASINGKRAGSWGLSGCWSFYPFKMLGGYGDGGALTTNSLEVAEYARRMRYNGEDRDTGEYHGHGFTCLLDNLQAAFLNVKLKHLPKWIVRRQEIAVKYHSALAPIKDLILPHYDYPGYVHVYQNYTVRARQGEEFSTYLRKSGIEILTQFRKPYYKHSGLNLVDKGFAEVEDLSREVCSLPLYPELNDDEIDYVISTVRAFYKR
jgi:dTDP-4-amino-4,6-dideoxygalactose transaminase